MCDSILEVTRIKTAFRVTIERTESLLKILGGNEIVPILPRVVIRIRAIIMPSLSPVEPLPTLHERADVENTREHDRRKSPQNSSRVENSFSEKLKVARKLISFHSGKVKLVRSDSESSTGSSDGSSDCSSSSSHSRFEHNINGYSCRSAELESKAFFRDYSIMLE